MVQKKNRFKGNLRFPSIVKVSDLRTIGVNREIRAFPIAPKSDGGGAGLGGSPF